MRTNLVFGGKTSSILLCSMLPRFLLCLLFTNNTLLTLPRTSPLGASSSPAVTENFSLFHTSVLYQALVT